MFLIFLEGVNITTIGLKLDRPQLQHWLLFLEHDRSENSNVVAGLPVSMGYDCIYDSACAPPVLLILSSAGSSSCIIWIMQASALADLRGRSENN